jgi:ADP-ribose pyrophosphatase
VTDRTENRGHHHAPPDAPWQPVEADSAGPGTPGRIGRTPVHRGRVLELSIDRVRFPDGSVGELEFARHAGASAVLAFMGPPDDPDPRVVLVRQYRYATGGELHEVPAGMADFPGEPWETVARRELREETGYEAGELRYLTRIYTTPGFTDEVIRIYAAWNLTPGDVERDVDEFMEVQVVPWAEAVEMVRVGRITDTKSVTALLWGATFLRPGG